MPLARIILYLLYRRSQIRSRIVRQQKNEELMAAGVTLVDPTTTYIDETVEIGADTVIGPITLAGSVSPTGQSRVNFSIGRLF